MYTTKKKTKYKDLCKINLY